MTELDKNAKHQTFLLLLALLSLLSLMAAGCSQGTAPPSAETAAAPATSAANSSGADAKRAEATGEGSRIPAYHATLESARPLPAPRPASRYKDYPIIERAYTVASEIPEVLALQPCYCYCDKSAGHGSLADCWASDHGAGWKVCLQEVLLAGQLNKKGMNPQQIRAAIIRGDWKKVNLEVEPASD